MTDYNPIPDNILQPDDPISADLGIRWRDNPIAIAECDPSVPIALLPQVPLGTLAMTSGAVQTLSGLALTSFKSLRITVNAVKSSSNNALRIAGINIGNPPASAGGGQSGTIIVDLVGGIATGMIYSGGTGGNGVLSADTGYSASTTSISFSLASGTYTGGSIALYGVK